MIMTKDVLITISGIQTMDGEKDNVEMITAGTYYKKNGKHYIMYEEMQDDFEGITKNTIKIAPGAMDIMKTGISCTHMMFEQDKKILSNYNTPMGMMVAGIDTKDIHMEEKEDSLTVNVKYDLELNYQFVAECNIAVVVQSKSGARISLGS